MGDFMQERMETERLILRPFTNIDAMRVKDLAGSIEIAKTTLHVPYPYRVDMAEEWIQALETGKKEGRIFAYAIDLKEPNELIGTCSLILDKANNKAELAYWIGYEYWNHGYGTEAAKRIMTEGFASLDINKIFAVHLGNNPSSGRLLEKIGMKKEGILEDHIIKWNEYQDLVYFGLLKKDST
jgi:RimJ/RimL family protein N-acetyltransferase